RPYLNTLDELIPELTGNALQVYYGGPVQKDTIHFLHQYATQIPGAIEGSNGIYWGGAVDNVVAMIDDRKIDPKKIRCFIGYSGWSDGQLEDEIKEKTWLTVEATRKLVFHSKPDEVWKDSLKHLGGEFEMMINYPIDPQLN